MRISLERALCRTPEYPCAALCRTPEYTPASADQLEQNGYRTPALRPAPSPLAHRRHTTPTDQ